MSGFAMWRNFELRIGRVVWRQSMQIARPNGYFFTVAEPEIEIVWGLRAH